MKERSARYLEQGEVFLEQAQQELSAGDLMQASEKGWGAAAQTVKAVGAERGWRHHSHGSLFEVVRLLNEETGDDMLQSEFDVAGALHANFYEGFLGPPGIESRLAVVERFIERLTTLLDQSAANGSDG